MPEIAGLSNSIYNIDSAAMFNEIAIEIFQHQYANNAIYRKYVDLIADDVKKISAIDEIPFLPIRFFKDHMIIAGDSKYQKVFTSSGTTGSTTSFHYVKDIDVYNKSFEKCFEIFFGNPEDYTIIALLPSYLERGGSSLVYMSEKLIEKSRNNQSGFYLNEYNELSELLKRHKQKGLKVVLLGVTYALLDMAEQFPMDFPELIIMETGGMKGRRKELVRDELHSILNAAFGTARIYSEYGMTELLSQAYSLGSGIYNCPPWMKVRIRDVNDPFSFLPNGKTGGINIIDLANIHSCSFIETQDLGKVNNDGTFEVLGRFDNSDVRGCNLLV